MNPDMMRKIDYWVGQPLAFFVTTWYKFLRIFDLKNPQYDIAPRNILFIELAEMGSTVLAYPALKKLKELYPEAPIHFLLFKQNAPAAQLIDLIPENNILTIDSLNIFTFLCDTIGVMFECRRRDIDTVINLEMFARYSTILSYLVGASKRVGFHRFFQEGLYTGDFLTHKVLYNPHIHTSQSFIALVQALAEDPSHIPLGKFPIQKTLPVLPKIVTDERGRKRIWEVLRSVNPSISENSKLILLNPNASKLIEQRKWPLESYANLAKKIIEEHEGICVVVTGSASEYEEGETLRKMAGSDRVLNLAGRTTLRDLIDLYNIADVLVTNDSGPAHFASLTNIHIMVFFGPETPALYKPLSKNCTVLYSWLACSPCVSAFNQRRTPCNANQCLRSIEVEEVYKKVSEVLKNS